jgi:hypothetical protein
MRILRDSLNILLKDPSLRHCRISNDDYSKEITVCIYDETNPNEFDERSKKLIIEDK